MDEKGAKYTGVILPEVRAKLEQMRNVLGSLAADCPRAIALGAYLRRWDMIEKAATTEGFAALDSKTPVLLKELSELSACLFAPLSERAKEMVALGRGEMGDKMVSAGLTFQETSKALEIADQRAAGRPWAKSPTKLLDGAQMRWEGRGLREIAAMPGFCDNPARHGTPDHDRVCETNLSRTLRRFRECPPLVET